MDYTSLVSAVRYCNTDKIKSLINDGIDVNINIDGESLLHIAIRHWQNSPNATLDTVKLLIKAGANINAVTTYMHTPLHYAIENENTEIVKLLINAGVNINIVTNEYKLSPLNSVSGYTDFELAFINIINEHSCPPLDYAINCCCNDTYIIKLLLNAIMY